MQLYFLINLNVHENTTIAVGLLYNAHYIRDCVLIYQIFEMSHSCFPRASIVTSLVTCNNIIVTLIFFFACKFMNLFIYTIEIIANNEILEIIIYIAHLK